MKIFDTTLRDGEQMPGVALSISEKLEIAMALDDAGVDMIEAGFAAVSDDEKEAIKLISKEVSRAKVVSLARMTKSDVDAAAEADVDMIHLFIATSDIHLKYKLGITREEALRRIEEVVSYAKSYGVEILFSAEDATRSDLEFLAKAYKTAIEAGADEINVPDTVGVMTPSRMAYLIKYLRERLPPIPMHVHCHDDFGMAVANTVTAIENGADVAQVVVNNFGERAGNAALEEVVAAVHYLLGLRTNIKLEKLYSLSQLVSKLFGVPVPPNKAVVGENAFSHEAGIHVHGVLNNPFTYEPMRPEDVGNRRRIVLGKHSGRHSVIWALKNLGVEPSEDLVNYVLDAVKKLAVKKVKVDEAVLREIVNRYNKGLSMSYAV
ncbi:homocitrate synthase family protein [Pyrobaculum aerophilum]|uniref:2-isopropylmalate synthase n=1 Tax=Pyrobaculum aerophilum TaxID=13773 RepID=A0A371R600_9CREN|nr:MULTISPECIES: homocitrate synthase family protein [Pyrobaculum]MCX8136933.1 homocitrate synthase family protein [Pyrobaculum aerophilum]RFA99441.1 homoaconitate hydratase [Pyrobaculum aerophilum]HII46988.1 2-isopropylmalate synthase [Pyrobaculum aerophilum]